MFNSTRPFFESIDTERDAFKVVSPGIACQGLPLSLALPHRITDSS